MGPLVHEGAVRGAKVFRPLVLHMDQRPLPPAEFEVLKAGELEVVLLKILAHPMRVQVTPEGMAPSSTVTV